MLKLQRRTLLKTSVTLTGAVALRGYTSDIARADTSGSSPDARRPAVGSSTAVDIREYCSGSGSTNDSPGVQKALNVLAAHGGGTLYVSPGTYALGHVGSISVPGGVRIVGAGAQSKFVLTGNGSGAFTNAFRVAGPNVSIENVAMVRGANVFGTFLAVEASNLWVGGCSFDGALSRWKNTFHGIYLSSNRSSISGFTLVNGSMKGCAYGVFMTEASSATVSDLWVGNFAFSGNYCDDLEFTAPRGSVRQIVVQDCTFASNAANGAGAGFGVGLANATGAKVSRCTFSDYPMNPVHIERGSRQISITSCNFVRTSTSDTGYAACVIILSGSNGVELNSNTFDLSQQTNPATGVFVGPGGVGEAAPLGVTLKGNTVVGQGRSVVANWAGPAAVTTY